MKPGVPELSIEVREDALHRVEGDCAVVGVFADQRPLRGGAGLVDWRLCGRLGELLQGGFLAERWALLPGEGRLGVPRVLVGVLGDSQGFDSSKLATFAAEAARRVLDLRAGDAAWDLAFAGPAVTADGAAAAVLQGFGGVLETAREPLVLRLCVPRDEGLRWRVAVERAVARRPRGSAPLRLTTVDAGGGREAPPAPPVIRRAQ